jgi:hypothetical protein
MIRRSRWGDSDPTNHPTWSSLFLASPTRQSRTLQIRTRIDVDLSPQRAGSSRRIRRTAGGDVCEGSLVRRKGLGNWEFL